MSDDTDAVEIARGLSQRGRGEVDSTVSGWARPACRDEEAQSNYRFGETSPFVTAAAIAGLRICGSEEVAERVDGRRHVLTGVPRHERLNTSDPSALGGRGLVHGVTVRGLGRQAAGW